MLPKTFMVVLLALLSAAAAKREHINEVVKAMNAEVYEVSQDQAELAMKEAEAMMADPNFSADLRAFAEQWKADPQSLKQLAALMGDPNLQKQAALVQEKMEALKADQPSLQEVEDDMNEALKVVSVKASDASQEQAQPAVKEADAMMPDPNFRDRLQGFAEQLGGDPQSLRQLEATTDRPNLQKQVALLPEQREAAKTKQPSLLQVSEIFGTQPPWKALAPLLLASHTADAFQLPGSAPRSRMGAGDFVKAPATSKLSNFASRHKVLQDTELTHMGSTGLHGGPKRYRRASTQIMAAVDDSLKLRVGDLIADVSLSTGFENKKKVSLRELTQGKKVVLVGLPDGCNSLGTLSGQGQKVPQWVLGYWLMNYLASQEAELKAEGVSDVISYCVNDGAGMQDWAAVSSVDMHSIEMLSFDDQGSVLRDELGWLGNPLRKRFSMFIDDSVIKAINVGEADDNTLDDANPTAALVQEMLKDIPVLIDDSVIKAIDEGEADDNTLDDANPTAALVLKDIPVLIDDSVIEAINEGEADDNTPDDTNPTAAPVQEMLKDIPDLPDSVEISRAPYVRAYFQKKKASTQMMPAVDDEMLKDMPDLPDSVEISRASTQMMPAVDDSLKLRVGDLIADVSLFTGFQNKKKVSLRELTQGKKVVLVGLPDGCDSLGTLSGPGQKVPQWVLGYWLMNYLASQEAELKAEGVSDVISYCVSDGPGMQDWAAVSTVDMHSIEMFSFDDQGSVLRDDLGWLGNPRRKRFSMLIDDSVIKAINVGEADDNTLDDANPTAALVQEMLKDIPDLPNSVEMLKDFIKSPPAD